jgi:hypothetical protein
MAKLKRKVASKRTVAGLRKKSAKSADAVKLISNSEAARLGIDAGSKAVKRLAAKQKFKIKLTTSQMRAIQSQLTRWNNAKPAELSFLVEGKTRAKFRVAAYAYRGDTCCA